MTLFGDSETMLYCCKKNFGFQCQYSLGFGDPWTSKRIRNLQELDNFNLITDRQTEDRLVELSFRSQNLDDVKEKNFILLLQVGIKDMIAFTGVSSFSVVSVRVRLLIY